MHHAKLGIAVVLILVILGPSIAQDEIWQLGPFIKQDSVNPIMGPINETTFYCPLRQEVVNWESKDIFNPGAILKDGRIHMLYRAEDTVGFYNGTSRIGLAFSDDGFTFNRLLQPVFYPDNDTSAIYEWEGGCEDPRVVLDPDGTFVMTYTAYDGELARLMVATSKDLITWEKHGSVFAQVDGGKFVDMWSKSGSVVTEVRNGTQQAVKIGNKYWMYFGETDIFAATSDDLINWVPVTDANGTENEFNLTSVFGPREGKFDSDIVEPGPPAILTEDGIVFIYNSRNKDPELGGDPNLARGTYSAGQVLIDATNPMNVLSRLEDYFFTPDRDYEIVGQVNNVVFLEGLVYFQDSVFLYYGTADSKIAVAKIN